MATTDHLAADPVNLHYLFSADNVLRCPLFQRPYVWRAENIKRLWEDVESVLDGQYEVRFLGALVFDNETASTSSSPGLYWVIDGQQRLTTLYLSLCALTELARESGAEDEAIALASEYLLSRKKSEQGRPKLAPTIADTRQFNQIVAKSLGYTAKVQHSNECGPSNGQMSDAYELIRAEVRKHCIGPDDHVSRASVEAVRDALLQRLEFVEIRLGQRHDANEVFDRLNKEGERLGIVDLVRNEILKRLKEDVEAATNVHATEWAPFEQSFSDKQSIEGYFFPHALTRDNSVTKSRTFLTLAKRWKEAHPALSGAQEVRAIMDDLRSHVPIYNHLKQGTPLDGTSGAYEIALAAIARMRPPTVVFPYFFSLHSAYEEGDVDGIQAADATRLIESFLVRRALCGYEPTGLHAIFKRLWQNAQADPQAVREHVESKTIKFPGDAEFRKNVKGAPLYTKAIRNYVMLEFERSFTKGDVLDVFPPMTADHVLPQSPQGQWLTDFNRNQIERWRDTWANLVPLTGKANSEKGRRSWAETRRLLKLETIFSTTKHLLDDYEEWNPEALQRRAQELADWALERWPERIK